MTETAVKPRLATTASPLHSGICVPMFLSLQITATLFPLAAGIAIYGWRALGTAGVVVTGFLQVMVKVRVRVQ